MKQTRPKERISRAFKSDYPEFVERVKALDVRISLSNSGGRRCYWLDGYRQLTGYTTKTGGFLFTEQDAKTNIDRALTEIEDDRRAIQSMSQDERFARVICEFRKMKTQHRMIGEVRIPCGDNGHCFFNATYDGGVKLFGVGIVARAKVLWSVSVGPQEQLALFCDALERDYAARAALSHDPKGDANQ